MPIPIVPTYIAIFLTTGQFISISLDLQNKKKKLSKEIIPRSPHSIVSNNEPVVSKEIVSYLKNYTTRNVSKYNKIHYHDVMTMKWLHKRFQ